MILNKGLIYAILFLLFSLASSGFYIMALKEKNNSLSKELLKIEVASEQEYARYDRDMKAFDYAMKEVVKFYDGTIADIKSFKKGTNETDCQAANRLLNRYAR